MSKLTKIVIAGSVVGVGIGVVRAIRSAEGADQGQSDSDADSGAAKPAMGPPPPPLGNWPKTPLTEPSHPNPRQRLNVSHYDSKSGTVRESATELLRQALRHDARITIDELTAARLAMSEHGSGSFTELCCIIDAELNRAQRRGVSLYDWLTHRDKFGKQGGRRKASTRQDPRMRHLLAARAVLSGEARGVARGAHRFFDPVEMDRGHRKWKQWLRKDWPADKKKPGAVTCDALGLLEAWSFDYGYHSKYRRCPPRRDVLGNNPEAWVGHIPGVDANRLMLMMKMKRGPEHTRRYQAARAFLLSRGRKP